MLSQMEGVFTHKHGRSSQQQKPKATIQGKEVSLTQPFAANIHDLDPINGRIFPFDSFDEVELP